VITASASASSCMSRRPRKPVALDGESAL